MIRRDTVVRSPLNSQRKWTRTGMHKVRAKLFRTSVLIFRTHYRWLLSGRHVPCLIEISLRPYFSPSFFLPLALSPCLSRSSRFKRKIDGSWGELFRLDESFLPSCSALRDGVTTRDLIVFTLSEIVRDVPSLRFLLLSRIDIPYFRRFLDKLESDPGICHWEWRSSLDLPALHDASSTFAHFKI